MVCSLNVCYFLVVPHGSLGVDVGPHAWRFQFDRLRLGDLDIFIGSGLLDAYHVLFVLLFEHVGLCFVFDLFDVHFDLLLFDDLGGDDYWYSGFLPRHPLEDG